MELTVRHPQLGNSDHLWPVHRQDEVRRKNELSGSKMMSVGLI